jgi:hypothetical protein
MNWVWSRGLRPPRLHAQVSSDGTAEHPHRLGARELAGTALLVLTVFATRLPWLAAGYGLDPDCSRIITAARHIAETGEYVYSRGPAYPVHEYLVAAVVRGGPVLTNGLSALFGCMAVLFFALILRRLEVRAYLLWALVFAFVPVVYVNCTCTIDYIPALAFMLASTYFTMVSRPLVSGMLLGLAIGTRVTSGAMLLPLALWTWLEGARGRRRKDLLTLISATLGTGLLAFLPALLGYGTAFFAFADWTKYPELHTVLFLGSQGVWGYSPGIVTAVSGFLFLLGAGLSINRPRPRFFWHALLTSALVVVLYVVAYLRLPLEAGYLIPAVPFALLALSLLYNPPYLQFVGVALLAAFLLAPGEHDPSRPSAILHDHRIREQKEESTRRIINKVNTLAPGSVVVVAWELPHILVELDKNLPDPDPYVYFITSEDQMLGYQRAGRDVYFLDGLDYYDLQIHQVDLVGLGARKLSLTDSDTVAPGGP